MDRVLGPPAESVVTQLITPDIEEDELLGVIPSQEVGRPTSPSWLNVRGRNSEEAIEPSLTSDWRGATGFGHVASSRLPAA
jgi:hypothetical protein